MAVLVSIGITHMMKVTATPVQLQDKKIEKQKEHAKLYKIYDVGPDLRKQAATGTGDITVEVSSPGKIYPSEPVSLPPFLNALACDADAIVIGIPKSGSSQFTENGSFIFTDYEMTVEQVLKDNINSTIQVGDNLIITRPGGSIQINGRTIHGNLEAFKPFKTGERYMLFLRFIPTTGAYRAFGIGSFQLRDNKVYGLGEAPLWGEINNLADAQAFITNVRTAAASNCETKPEVLR
jgi:hypothetical protein